LQKRDGKKSPGYQSYHGLHYLLQTNWPMSKSQNWFAKTVDEFDYNDTNQ
jgi:hypothetical protein